MKSGNLSIEEIVEAFEALNKEQPGSFLTSHVLIPASLIDNELTTDLESLGAKNSFQFSEESYIVHRNIDSKVALVQLKHYFGKSFPTEAVIYADSDLIENMKTKIYRDTLMEDLSKDDKQATRIKI
ncbi:hypothetical protein [Burkholderia contaminans]|uniref:hypothetical protein n=1 Tax=Burkholderia contaminans TaxID=488447 RepID=UPI00158DFC50|nr:hypothetical protein [Burkholderia contaminans]